MEDDNLAIDDVSDEPFKIEIKPNGVPESVVLFVCCLLLVSFVFNFVLAKGISDSNIPKDEPNKAALSAQQEQSKAFIESEKMVRDIRLDVAKRCEQRGNIPIFVNGNVDCKFSPK